MSTHKPGTRELSGTRNFILSLTVCVAPLPEVLQRAYEIKMRQDSRSKVREKKAAPILNLLVL